MSKLNSNVNYSKLSVYALVTIFSIVTFSQTVCMEGLLPLGQINDFVSSAKCIAEGVSENQSPGAVRKLVSGNKYRYDGNNIELRKFKSGHNRAFHRLPKKFFGMLHSLENRFPHMNRREKSDTYELYDKWIRQEYAKANGLMGGLIMNSFPASQLNDIGKANNRIREVILNKLVSIKNNANSYGKITRSNKMKLANEKRRKRFRRR